MVIFELLGHRKMGEATTQHDGAARAVGVGAQADDADGAPTTKVAPARLQRRSRVKIERRLVRSFFQDHVQSAPEARVEMKALTRGIRAWSSSRGLALPGLNELLDDIAAVCQERGINIEVADDERVHCLGVRLAAVDVPAVH